MKNAEQNSVKAMHDAAVRGYRSWPFDASRLFYTKKENDDAGKKPDIKMKGILSYMHVCGFLYTFADRVRRETDRFISVVMIQREDPVEDSREDPANGNRIDTGLLNDAAGIRCSYPLCGRCKGKKCIKLENAVAETVLGRTAQDLEAPEQLQALRGVLSSFTDRKGAPGDTDLDPCYAEDFSAGSDPGTKHIYYRFNCPMTLVGGVMMPVVVNGIVIAAAIVGQFIWNEAHRMAVLQKYYGDDSWDRFAYERNDDIIKLLTETVTDLENSLEQRLNRNAAGLFSEIITEVHTRISKKETLNNRDLRIAIEDALQFLQHKLSAGEMLFYPLDRRVLTDGKDVDAFGKQRGLPRKVTPVRKAWAEEKQIAKNYSNTVFLTVPAMGQYLLHLFDDTGEELCRLSYIMAPGERSSLRQEEWNAFCYHMETVLQELYMQWALVQREEEHAQYNVTMRQFTHELGQKSHSGNAGMLQMSRQLETLRRLTDGGRGDYRAQTAEIGKLERTAKDMQSIFDGIEYLSQLARAKAQGLKFNPMDFDVRYAILNSLEAQYRIDIRTRGMLITYRPTDGNYNRIYGDPELVHIAVHNLISNAVKYGAVGTNIYYNCYKGEDDRGRRGTVIDVVDYGLFIREEDRERIFENGARLDEARNDSMGFGLFLTRQIMELHGGYCEVAESRIVCDFSLPYLEEMLRYENRLPRGITADFEQLRAALREAKESGLFAEAVYRPVRVSGPEDEEVIITPRRLFVEGLKPMAKTTMRLFFPEKEEF